MPITANIYDLSDGRITGFMEAQPATLAANLSASQGVYIGPIVGGATHYIAQEPLRVEPRPMLAPPTSPQVAGWAYDMSGLPVGSVVTARNEVGDEMVLTDLLNPLILGDAGIFSVRVDPPFPWLGFDAEIEVTHA